MATTDEKLARIEDKIDTIVDKIGGGAGGYAEVITSPSATYSYAVGVLVTGNGGNGAAGQIVVTEYYQL